MRNKRTAGIKRLPDAEVFGCVSLCNAKVMAPGLLRLPVISPSLEINACPGPLARLLPGGIPTPFQQK